MLSPLIPLILVGWVPFSLVFFAVLPRRWAVIAAVICGWCLLPPTGFRISGLTGFGKGPAIAMGALLGTLVFTPDRILRFRPAVLDLPMLCFCFAPFASSLSNGLGAYDGASTSVGRITAWGLSYLVGRLHFDGERRLRDLITGIAVAGMVQIPFCLYEMRFSSTLLTRVYGLGGFQRERLGGWRPRLLFQNGLESGFWFSVCFFSAYWLWRSGVLTRLAGLPMGRLLLPVLGVVTLLCRSTGALAELAMGVGALWTSTRFRKRLPALVLISVPFCYVAVRVSNVWDYSKLISFIETNLDPERSQSLEFRFQNEDILVEKAIQRPVFGWGGWGRARVYNEDQQDVSFTDGLWVILLGTTGAFGLGSFLISWLLPCYVFAWRYQPKEWGEPIAAGQAAAACICAMYMIECLMNGFINVVYLAALGGLVSSLQAGRDKSLQVDQGKERARLDPDEDPAGVDQPIGAGAIEARLADRYVGLARAAQRSGSAEGAALAWRQALRFLDGRCAAAPEDRDLARRRLDCANDLAWFLAIRPDPRNGDHDEAVELARETTGAETGDPAYWNTLALALHRAGDDLGALEAAGRSMDLAEASTGFDFAVLALAHARIGRKDEAGRWLAAARQWRDANHPPDQALDDLLGEAAAALAD